MRAISDATSAESQAQGPEVAALPPIVTLECASEAWPDWLTPGVELRVPVPRCEPVALSDGRVLVWGRADTGKRVPLVALSEAGLELAYPWWHWQSHVRSERYAVWRRRPMHTRLPMGYRAVPARLKRLAADRRGSAAGRGQPSFPEWPFDNGFEALRSVVGRYSASVACEPPARVCLTHDVDTSRGCRFVEQVGNLEAALGVRSCWNVTAGGGVMDEGVCEWLAENGFEIGLHGAGHDDRSIYLSKTALRRRLDACEPFITRYGVRGFRSRSWLRNMKLMQALPDYVDYDSSCLDFDWLSPAGRGGVLSASPFRFRRLVEIPTTLPIERLAALEEEASKAEVWWRRKIDWLVRVGGQAVVSLPADDADVSTPAGLRSYERFLEHLLACFEGRWSLPCALADEVTWAARGRSIQPGEEATGGRIHTFPVIS